MMPAKKWTKETIIEEINYLNKQGVHMSQTNISKINSALFHAAKKYFGGWREAAESSGVDYEEVLNISKLKLSNKRTNPRKRTPNKFVIIDDHKELIVNKRDGSQKIVLVDKDFNFNGKIIVNYDKAYLNADHGRDRRQLGRYIMNVTDPDILVYHINGNTLDNRRKNLALISNKSTDPKEVKQMDELKIYTGKEALQKLLNGKVMKCINPKVKYKIDNNILYQEGFTGWSISDLQLIDFLSLEFTEINTPQIGEWVKVECLNKIYIGQINKIDGNKMYSYWNNKKGDLFFKTDSKDVFWEILTPEQVSEYKREQAFVKVGRKPNEFRSGDIVMIDCLETVAIVISKKNEVNSIIKLHGINEVGKGYDAGAHQLTPISFVEDQVSLD